MTFDYLIKTCQLESKPTEQKNVAYLNTILNKLMIYITKEVENNPSISMKDVNKKIHNKIQSYLRQMNELNVRYRIIEYYLGNKSNSQELNFRKNYKKIYEDDLSGTIDIKNLNKESLAYTNNMNSNMEKLIIAIVAKIRENKESYLKEEGMEDVLKQLATKSSKERTAFLERIVRELDVSDEDKKNIVKDVEGAYKLFSKPEIEIAEELFKEYTQTASKSVRNECIKSIQENTNLLDEFGLLDFYIESNNRAYKKIYINGINYTYDEVKEMLKEENLRKLNVEELIVMSSFWTNRVNKVIKQLNKAVYVVNHKELLKEVTVDNGKIKYRINIEDMKNVDFKMNVIHKLYFELFEQLKNKDLVEENNVIEIETYLDNIVKRHKKDYKEYFDILFPKSKNSLKVDLSIANIFENARYNSYHIKNINMQALLICLFTSGNKNIENFGYIPEKDKKKKEILIGADIKGFNMPFALHINKDSVLNFIKEYQGNTMFPLYKNMSDFNLSQDVVLKPQIFLPLTREADNAIKKAANTTTPRDRYGKAVMHLNYLRKEGKMPEHMMQMQTDKKKKVYVREYEDLGKCDIDMEKER